MALTGKRLLAIDWDRKDLRMAMVRPRAERIELLKAVSVPLPADLAVDNAEQLGAFIREAMRQSGIGARHALMAIPRDQVVINSLNLPPTPADDLPALVQFQVVKELPFAADQAAIDFAVPAGHEPKSGAKVLVAAVRVEELAFYKNVAREAGLTLERVGLRPYSNRQAVLASMPDLAERTVLVVEVGPYLTEIDIFDKGSLAFSRAAMLSLPQAERQDRERVLDSRISMIPPLDAEDDEITRETVNRMMVEVVRSYEAHRATSPQTHVDQIVVCGATGIEMELAHSLAARFAAKAQLFSPEKVLDLSPQRARELRGFSAVLGLAMGHERPPLESFDFLKPKKQISRRIKRLKKAPIAIGAAILLIGTIVLMHFRIVRPARAEAEKVRVQAEKLQIIEDPYENFIKQVNALQDWKKSEQYWPEVIVALTRVFPPEQRVSVDRLDLDSRVAPRSSMRKGHLSLKLRVAESGTVNEISELLRAMGCDPVEPGPETPRAFRGREEIYRFDTGVRATLPQREPRSAEDELEESDAALADVDAEGGESDGAATEVSTTTPVVPATAADNAGASPTPPKQGATPRTGGAP